MKKVLIFTLDYYPGAVGGAESAIKDITDRINPEEIEFHMVTLFYDSKTPRTEKIGNVLVHRVGIWSKPEATMEQRRQFPLHYNKHFFQIAAAFKALSLHRKHNYDAIWAMMAHTSGVPAAIFNLFNPKVPYVLSLQEGDPPEHIERVMRPLWPLFKRSFTKADLVQSISEFLSDWARKMGYKGDIELIRDGANPDSLRPSFSSEDVEKLKRELGKKEGDVFMVNTARLVHQKGWDTVIKSLPLLPDNVRLLVVGGGDLDEMLKDLVKDLKLEKRVVFTGQVERSVVSRYRAVSDIMVGASRSEGLGHAFLSGMALDLPVVSTQVGGIADYVFDKERNPDKKPTGFAVDVDNPEQIAEKVKYILDNPDEVKEVVANAREMVFKEYDWDIIARDMQEKVFNRVFSLIK